MGGVRRGAVQPIRGVVGAVGIRGVVRMGGCEGVCVEGEGEKGCERGGWKVVKVGKYGFNARRVRCVKLV